MKTINILIIAVANLLFVSCIKDKYTDDSFKLNKNEYFGKQLKIDGYYYSSVENEDYFSLYVFYRNGVVLIPGVSDNPDEYLDGFTSGSGINNKDSWGLFLIENNTIQIEYYEPKMIEGMAAYLKTGEIINDTTFVITEVKRSKDGSERMTINETYQYKQFIPKPDSTNKFIK